MIVYRTHKKADAAHTKKKTEVALLQKKKELTEAQKKDLAMKLEIAEELGLMEKVEQLGWKGLTSRESGRIGGIMGKRRKAERKQEKERNQ